MTFFAELARLSDSLAQESSRLKKRAAIADAIARTHASAPDTPDAGLFAQYLSPSGTRASSTPAAHSSAVPSKRSPQPTTSS
jgi:hypothetical protein